MTAPKLPAKTWASIGALIIAVVGGVVALKMV